MSAASTHADELMFSNSSGGGCAESATASGSQKPGRTNKNNQKERAKAQAHAREALMLQQSEEIAELKAQIAALSEGYAI